MKRIKTAVLGLLLVAGVAQANWVHLHTNKKGDVVYIEDDSMTENNDDGQIIQAWLVINLKRPMIINDKEAYSMTAQYEFECHEKLTRMLKGAAFSEHDLEGDDVGFDGRAERVYQEPKKGTSEYYAMKWVCED